MLDRNLGRIQTPVLGVHYPLLVAVLLVLVRQRHLMEAIVDIRLVPLLHLACNLRRQIRETKTERHLLRHESLIGLLLERLLHFIHVLLVEQRAFVLHWRLREVPLVMTLVL